MRNGRPSGFIITLVFRIGLILERWLVECIFIYKSVCQKIEKKNFACSQAVLAKLNVVPTVKVSCLICLQARSAHHYWHHERPLLLATWLLPSFSMFKHILAFVFGFLWLFLWCIKKLEFIFIFNQFMFLFFYCIIVSWEQVSHDFALVYCDHYYLLSMVFWLFVYVDSPHILMRWNYS